MSNTYGDAAIEAAFNEPLEVWENKVKTPYQIHIEHPEFTALCPRSGYPDFGTVVIDYIPGDLVVELKAIKLFINGFRQQRISHEHVINVIADRLEKEIQPVSLRVIGDFMRRGNVKTVITVKRGEAYNFTHYQASVL